MDFEAFRLAARSAWAAGLDPQHVDFTNQFPLPLGTGSERGQKRPLTVTRAFFQKAALCALNADPQRFNLLYKILWRLSSGEAALLSLPSDPDVRRLEILVHEVLEDEHRMHAFVRFRRVIDDEGERFVAWYEPRHQVLHRAAPFFQRRFASMRWSILTPEESVHWNGESLSFSAGVPREMAPRDDELEALWRTYYASTFNPARANPKLLQKHIPSHYWKEMPELAQVPALLAAAGTRTASMLAAKEEEGPLATPPSVEDLPALAAAARGCTACRLHERATQTVFGIGPRDAKAMLIGEQPGETEDLSGTPFIGPAGEVLDRALAEAGLPRSALYLTNAVKHFNWSEERDGGTRRIHEKPGRTEVRACKPWLGAEIGLIKPRFIVCLGATAASSLLGANFRLTHSRGQIFSLPDQPWVLATWHPSAILRADEVRAARLFQDLVSDLKILAEAVDSLHDVS